MRTLSRCLIIVGILWLGMGSAAAQSMPVEVIFNDPIEDNNFVNRGWYDNTNQVLSNDGAIPGSTQSIEYQYNQGANKPTNGAAMRRKFTASDSVYVSYYVKYSNNWVGSQQNYHPHEFYLLTNKEGDYSGLAFTNLTAYVEQVDLRPRIAIQDGKNIDTGNINQNLVNVTENRAVSGCNGDSDGTGNGDCYSVGGGEYWNGKLWEGSSTISRNVWHRVEAFIKLNSVQNGKGIADGVIRYWLDGQLILERENIMLRTAKHADMLMDKIVIAPWIGDGSPITQTMWVDELTVGTQNPNAGDTIPNPPSSISVD